MKSFRGLLPVAFLFISLSIGIAPYFACNKDKCKGVSCLNDGVCHGGACTCATGYEGANCSVAWRNKFLGNWTQSNSADPVASQPFTISISADTADVTKVFIANFNNTSIVPISAYVSASDTLIISQQLSGNEIAGGYAHYISGPGIMVNYEVLNYVTNELDTVVTQWK